MSALDKLKKEFFRVAKGSPDQRWASFEQQLDQLARAISDRAIAALAAEVPKMRQLSNGDSDQLKGAPDGLVFGLPGVLEWRLAFHMADAAQSFVDERKPESSEPGFDEELDLYRAFLTSASEPRSF